MGASSTGSLENRGSLGTVQKASSSRNPDSIWICDGNMSVGCARISKNCVKHQNMLFNKYQGYFLDIIKQHIIPLHDIYNTVKVQYFWLCSADIFATLFLIAILRIKFCKNEKNDIIIGKDLS